jgi:hypothetical protein
MEYIIAFNLPIGASTTHMELQHTTRIRNMVVMGFYKITSEFASTTHMEFKWSINALASASNMDGLETTRTKGRIMDCTATFKTHMKALQGTHTKHMDLVFFPTRI